MDSSVTAGEEVRVAVIMAMRTDFRSGVVLSAGWAVEWVGVGVLVGSGGVAVVEKRPRQSSGQVERR